MRRSLTQVADEMYMTRKKESRLNTQAQANSTAHARNVIFFHLFRFHSISATYVCYESAKPRVTFFFVHFLFKYSKESWENMTVRIKIKLCFQDATVGILNCVDFNVTIFILVGG